MWVMTTRGFYSTVLTEDGRAMVRGRWREDLERFVEATSTDSPVLETLHADYPYRVIVPREVLAAFLADEAEAIDYRNFKSEITRRQGRHRHDVYMDAWSALRRGEGPRVPDGGSMSDTDGRLDP